MGSEGVACSHAGRSGRRVVSAFIATAFAQDDAEAARQQWRRVADQIRAKVPKLATLMDQSEADVLAYSTFPSQHRTKLHSTNPLERLNGEMAMWSRAHPGDGLPVRHGARLKAMSRSLTRDRRQGNRNGHEPALSGPSVVVAGWNLASGTTRFLPSKREESMQRVLAATSCAAIVAFGSLHAMAAGSTAQGTTLAQESPDQWRSSKLVGVAIYGPDDKSVGKITDMLMGKDGKVAFVVIGVGGFLGIGEKDVAVPFAAVDFSDKPIPQPAMPLDNNIAATSTSAPAGTENRAASGMPTPAPAGGMATTAPEMPAPSTAYPDHGTIAMNKDQLKQAPPFQFVR